MRSSGLKMLLFKGALTLRARPQACDLQAHVGLGVLSMEPA